MSEKREELIFEIYTWLDNELMIYKERETIIKGNEDEFPDWKIKLEYMNGRRDVALVMMDKLKKLHATLAHAPTPPD